MHRFFLYRTSDVSGVSGVGVVAEGIEFSDGKIAMRWVVGANRSTAVYESARAVEAIHGHDGKTRIHWLNVDTEHDTAVRERERLNAPFIYQRPATAYLPYDQIDKAMHREDVGGRS